MSVMSACFCFQHSNAQTYPTLTFNINFVSMLSLFVAGADVDEENLHMLENDDIRLLTPVVGVQLQIRAFRDCRKVKRFVTRPYFDKL